MKQSADGNGFTEIVEALHGYLGLQDLHLNAVLGQNLQSFRSRHRFPQREPQLVPQKYPRTIERIFSAMASISSRSSQARSTMPAATSGLEVRVSDDAAALRDSSMRRSSTSTAVSSSDEEAISG